MINGMPPGRGRGRGRGRGGRGGRGPVYPVAGAVVKRGTKAPLVAQPGFLATVRAGGPGGGGNNLPCRVAFHPAALQAGPHSAYPGYSMFTPDRVGGPGSALSAPCPPDLALGPNGLGEIIDNGR